MESKREAALELSAVVASSTANDDDDFNCPICYDILLDPVTVSCGHTCCQHCLLRYLKSASQVRCPAGCATTLPRTLPAVNVLLRSRLERTYGPQLAQRRKDVEHDRKLGLIPDVPAREASPIGTATGAPVPIGGPAAAPGPVAVDFVQDPVAVFDNPAWDAIAEQSRKAARLTTLRLILAIMMSLMAYMAVPQPAPPADLGDVSNVRFWTPVEVANWVGSQSETDVAALKDIFIEKDISGALLLTLNSKHLEELSPEMDSVAGKRLALLVHKLQTTPRTPTDFWEYYDLHPHGTMVMITGIIVAPRTSLLYLHFFDPSILAGVVGSQLVFWFGLFVSPHVLTALYVLKFVHVHPRLVTCLCFTLLWHAQTDATALPTLRDKPREYLRLWGSSLAWLSGVAAVFPALPNFMQVLLLWWCLFGPLSQLFFACCVVFCPRVWPPFVAWAQRQEAQRPARARHAALAAARA